MPAEEDKKEEEAAPAPEAPSLMGMLRQFIMLPVLWGSGKVDWEVAETKLALRSCAVLVAFIGFCLLQLALARAGSSKLEGRVAKPGSGQFMPKEGDPEMAADGSVSIQTYDTAKLKEARMQFGMSVIMILGLHFKLGYTQPLIMLCIMQPLQLWDSKPMQIHLRGVSGPAYERPWKAAASGNPLADWAEKKKAEMEEEEGKRKQKELKQD